MEGSGEGRQRRAAPAASGACGERQSRPLNEPPACPMRRIQKGGGTSAHHRRAPAQTRPLRATGYAALCKPSRTMARRRWLWSWERVALVHIGPISCIRSAPSMSVRTTPAS